ncbi:D-Tyr tRNAtyr deacylase-like domain-containing protein [Dioszegia hungarica]|uniref:D-aminoacyl-tRNA deacylase n=1 Tax=Dioszegia hungarica TaxID=4972 RepID=A0AA38HD32_9TREE|nr:D-Tyr tRNAtyr deacylase-like domain-containing protein [Dioszegia hungarica]KAI9638365.1 D-Tyr tRNAtyr deacylase-like domain-containing protein [Dioszegia hungarica]
MRAVLQRVTRASVTVDGEVISEIGRGLLVLIGIDKNDQKSDSDILTKKILGAKLFEDPGDAWGSWKRSVKDIDGEVLCVSQFTLMAVFKGSKPDFHDAMPSTVSRDFYYNFLEDMRKTHKPDKIKDGKFGGMMDVSLLNDGPLTIILDSLDSRSGKPKPRDGQSTPASGVSGSATPAGDGAEEDQSPEAYKARAKAKADKRAANAKMFAERKAAEEAAKSAGGGAVGGAGAEA